MQIWKSKTRSASFGIPYLNPKDKIVINKFFSYKKGDKIEIEFDIKKNVDVKMYYIPMF